MTSNLTLEPPVKPKIERKEEELNDAPDATIEVGSKCKRPSCGKPFVDTASRTESCTFHSGVPVFHEGSKGWSCCTRKVLEFDQFLKIKGCKQGLHRFTEPQVEGPRVVDCRRDWYQTQDKVMISVFAKKVDKEKTKIVFNSTQLTVDVVFQDGSINQWNTELFQPIQVEQSTFDILSTKIEISLAKSNGISWAAIEPRSDLTSWTTFGLSGTGGGTVGAKEALVAGDAPIHLLKK
jgi:hypothetical protein